MNASSKTRRWLIALAVILVLLAGGFAAHTWLGGKKEAPPPSSVVEIGDIERTVTAVGSLQPKEYVDVGTQVSLSLIHI